MISPFCSLPSLLNSLDGIGGFQRAKAGRIGTFQHQQTRQVLDGPDLTQELIAILMPQRSLLYQKWGSCSADWPICRADFVP